MCHPPDQPCNQARKTNLIPISIQFFLLPKPWIIFLSMFPLVEVKLFRPSLKVQPKNKCPCGHPIGPRHRSYGTAAVLNTNMYEFRTANLWHASPHANADWRAGRHTNLQGDTPRKQLACLPAHQSVDDLQLSSPISTTY
jgi:hypothetical protein